MLEIQGLLGHSDLDTCLYNRLIHNRLIHLTGILNLVLIRTHGYHN